MKKTAQQLLIPKKKVTLEEFNKSFDNNDIPFDINRNELVDRVYSDICGVLNEEDISDGWTSYRSPSGEYFTAINHLFVNKWLFQNNKISIGIYENIFDNFELENVIIEYFSEDRDLLMKFIEIYRKLNMIPENNSEYIKNDTCEEYYWRLSIDKKEFFNKTKEVIKCHIKNYIYC